MSHRKKVEVPPLERHRPKGSRVHLLNHPDRFKYAALHGLIENNFFPTPRRPKGSAQRAALLVEYLFSFDAPIDPKLVDGIFVDTVEFAQRHRRDDPSRMVKTRADTTLRELNTFLKDPKGSPSRLWLDACGRYFVLLLPQVHKFPPDPAAAMVAGLLQQAGWGETLARIEKRLRGGLRSPFIERLWLDMLRDLASAARHNGIISEESAMAYK